MANCSNSNERLFGAAVVLEIADGCPDVKPLESEWKALAAGTSKGFDFSPNSVTSDADDGAGFVETIITNSDFTISFEGEVRKKDKLDQYGIGKFISYFATELKAKRQPGVWIRMGYGPIEFVGYMNISALSSDGGSNDIVTFSTEFKVGDASTIEVNEVTAVAVTGVTVTPATNTGAAGGTSTFTVNITPTGATNKDFSVASTDPTKATATASGNTVTVTRVAAGSAQIVINTEDGNFVATHTVTVS
ncbi:Ig-like domain-containing protein [Atlantibacter hermannii]|uniref:Ig-like domain-containing protein n=1 Tax=Atlantibacter hermannii TaxID=565 RepID=UPI0028A76CE5|nr:Ig-like domain-containing protein [Atlantibacter hermannii]